MKLQIATLLCIFGVAACSHDKPAESAYDESTQTAALDSTPATTDGGDPLTPASAEGSAAATSGSGSTTPSTTDTAPASGTTTSSAPAPTAAQPMPATDNVDHPEGSGNAPPDNTKVNKRDTKSSALTPTDQGEGKTDLKITQQIRQAVMGDNSLSFTAKNVKIITVNGKVTLRGPVNNEQERTAIEAAARKVAGADKVDNQLEVKK